MRNRTSTGTAHRRTDGRNGAAPEAQEGRKLQEFRTEALPHMEAVRGFAVRLAASEAEADDLLQETFTRAFVAWDQYTLGTRCRSWLFTICRNVFLRERRRRRRHRKLLQENAPDDPGHPGTRDPMLSERRTTDPETELFGEIVDKSVQDAIDGLTERYRIAVLMCDLEGLPYKEAAEALDVPVGTLKSRLHRGRKQLREELMEYGTRLGYVRKSGKEEKTRFPERAA